MGNASEYTFAKNSIWIGILHSHETNQVSVNIEAVIISV